MKFFISPILILFTVFSCMMYAQQIKMGTNLGSVKEGALLELDDPNKALLLNRVVDPATTIGANSYPGMLVYDSLSNQLAFYDGKNWVNPLTWVTAGNNIYTTSSSLMGNRQVNLAGFGLSFKQGTDSIYLKGGKMGVSVVPISALHVKGAVRSDSLVLTSTKLYKSLNRTTDSLAVIDIQGKVMKVGVNEVASSASSTASNVLDWQYVLYSGTSGTWLSPNLLLDGLLSTYVATSVFTSFATSARSNYIPAKDSVIVTLDVYATALGARAGIIGLRLLEYSDIFGTLVKTDTLDVFVRGNSFSTHIVGGGWSNGIVYGKKLNSSTRFVRVEYYMNSNNVANGNGFKNVQVVSYASSTNAPFVNGGNSFGTAAAIGTTDANALSIITNGTRRMYIDASGNIGIATTAPSYALHVAGDIRSNSTIYAVKLQGISDIRLKQGISPIQGALSKVSQLQGVTYTWRKNMEQQAGYTFKEGKDYGLIAQEVQKILPELVEKDKNGFLTVDYPHIVPILVEAIKEQKKEVDQLKEEIYELKSMVKELIKSKN